MQRADDTIRKALLEAVLEFLEAAVHTVLKARHVYSPELFANRRLYGISVSQCRHPDVCLYIGTVLSNLKVCMETPVAGKGYLSLYTTYFGMYESSIANSMS